MLLTIYLDPLASATSFCKCTCKGNSTIIALNPQTSSSSSSNEPPSLSFRDLIQEREADILGGRDEEETRKTYRASTCTDCNRKFCLDYKLPGCKGVREEEIFTTCFRTSLHHLLSEFFSALHFVAGYESANRKPSNPYLLTHY